MKNWIVHNGIYFPEDTSLVIQEVLEDCINRKVLVHILTGDPLTGIVTPNLNSVGIIDVASGPTPTPILRIKQFYTPEGIRAKLKEDKMSWLKPNKILKIVEVDSCKLLYQSYECRSTPLKFIHEVDITPYGDIVERSKVICEQPQVELLVPSDANPKAVCEFLFGQIHHLPDCLDKLEEDIKNDID